MASKLPLSEATVRRRLKRLAEADAISLRATIDPSFMGFTIQALIGLKVRIDVADKVMKTLCGWDNVTYCAAVAGRYDLILIGLFASVEDMLEFIERQVGTLEGVQSSETLVCLRIVKGRHTFMAAQAEKLAGPQLQARSRRRRS
jgi:Lrp/AsnC family transcriptional regulator, regulator for asnA, asnC and gidA